MSSNSNYAVKKATLASVTTMTDHSIMSSSDPIHSFDSNKSFNSDDSSMINTATPPVHKHAEVFFNLSLSYLDRISFCIFFHICDIDLFKF